MACFNDFGCIFFVLSISMWYVSVCARTCLHGYESDVGLLVLMLGFVLFYFSLHLPGDYRWKLASW